MKQSMTRLISPDEFEVYGIQKEYKYRTPFDFTEFRDGEEDVQKQVSSSDLNLEMKSKNPRARKTGRTLKGFAGTVEKDRVDDIIPIETFIGARKDLLQPGASTMFLNHDTNMPIGIVASTAIVREKGLFFEGFISKAGDVNDIWTKAEEGILNAFSVRLRPKKVEVQEDGDGRVEAFVIKEMNLIEVSLVGVPANQGATVTDVISKSFDNAKSKYNENKKEKPIMNDDIKLGTMKDLVTDTVGKQLDSKLDAFLGKVGESIDDKIVKAFEARDAATAKALEEAEKEAKAKSDKEKADKDTADAKVLADAKDDAIAKALLGITEMLKSSQNTGSGTGEPTKKGSESEYKSAEGNTDGAPKKVLKSVTDVDTLKYVLYIAQNDDEYEKLTESEKKLAKTFMFNAHVASVSK